MSVTPHNISQFSVDTLVERWSTARSRTFLAKHSGRQLDPRELFAELAYGVRIAQEVTAGRWCVVADLLRLGTVDSWSQITAATDMAETDVRDGFHAWTKAQLDLRRRTGSIGITEAEAAELYALSEAVTW
ncbi:hypothetical protein [Amycolatopsis sp. NPDC052450]|uniref:hypothetical protein n=1 Tax=Amycolatopsis sp. NPDC052450 TaxID=3363937 RepID=UPI0037CA0CA3